MVMIDIHVPWFPFTFLTFCLSEFAARAAMWYAFFHWYIFIPTGRQTETKKSVSVFYNMFFFLLFYLECMGWPFSFSFSSHHLLVHIHSIPSSSSSSSSISQCVYDSWLFIFFFFLFGFFFFFFSCPTFCFVYIMGKERKHLPVCHVCHVVVLIPCPEMLFRDWKNQVYLFHYAIP